MKGIVLAGGSGSRLSPLTLATSKQLLPVFNKPLIYYPLSTLMAANVRDILVITTPDSSAQFRRLLGDGSNWGITLDYCVQPTPNGIAEALLLGEEFIRGDEVALILGDNIFHGPGLGRSLSDMSLESHARIYAYRVRDPSNYGVVTIREDGTAAKLEEKPTAPESPYAVPGLYFYPPDVVGIAREIQPSARGELEITSINQVYLEQRRLNVSVLSRGTMWLDAGTPESLLEAGELVRTLEQRQGIAVGSPEEVAWRNKWISESHLLHLAALAEGTDYGTYLRDLVGIPGWR